MFDSIPTCESCALDDLAQSWQVSVSALRRWIVGGKIVSHVWLPVMSVYKMQSVIDGANVRLAWNLCHWEGYIPMSPRGCRRLFRHGRIHLREFNGAKCGERFKLPECAEDIAVDLGDLVVLEPDRKRFERTTDFAAFCRAAKPGIYPATEQNVERVFYAVDAEFKIVRYEGAEYRFGDMQAKALRLLWEASKEGQPWQNGKRLLQQVGSQGYTLSNLYKRNPIWKKLIQSDKRGSYRLHPNCLDM